MATSGSTDWTLNRDAIIRQALLNLRVVDPALTTPAQDITDGTLAANAMIKAWQLDGVFMWLTEEVVVHLQKDSQYFSLGPSGDNCCLLSDAVSTVTTAAASETDSTITVSDATGIASGDYIGVHLDEGSLQWTTVNGAPADGVVTLTAALTGAVASGATVYAYTSKIARPLQIMEARIRDEDDVDTPVQIHHSRTEFFQQTDKTTSGRILEVFYNPDHTNGKLYVWPVAASGDISDRLVMSIQRVVEDLDSSADNFDGPVEALPALIWGLSVWLAPQYGVDLTMGKGATIAAAAMGYYTKLKQFYTDREPIYIRPR